VADQCEEIARLLGIDPPVQPTGAKDRKIRQVQAQLALMENAATALRRELAALTDVSSSRARRRPAS
jgi:hypothetical protein